MTIGQTAIANSALGDVETRERKHISATYAQSVATSTSTTTTRTRELKSVYNTASVTGSLITTERNRNITTTTQTVKNTPVTTNISRYREIIPEKTHTKNKNIKTTIDRKRIIQTENTASIAEAHTIDTELSWTFVTGPSTITTESNNILPSRHQVIVAEPSVSADGSVSATFQFTGDLEERLDIVETVFMIEYDPATGIYNIKKSPVTGVIKQ